MTSVKINFKLNRIPTIRTMFENWPISIAEIQYCSQRDGGGYVLHFDFVLAMCLRELSSLGYCIPTGACRRCICQVLLINMYMYKGKGTAWGKIKIVRDCSNSDSALAFNFQFILSASVCWEKITGNWCRVSPILSVFILFFLQFNS